MSTDHDEAGLIARLKENDFSAQLELMSIYDGKLTRFAMNFGLSREDAVEVVSQSLQKVIEKIDLYDVGRGARFSTWVFQIAKNTIIDRLRKIQQEQAGTDGPLESTEKLEEEHQMGRVEAHFPSDEEEPESEEIDHIILYQALESLDPDDREVLLQWAYGVSFKEIGQLINKKEGAAKVKKHRAVPKLRREYLRILADQDRETQEAFKARYEAIRRELP